MEYCEEGDMAFHIKRKRKSIFIIKSGNAFWWKSNFELVHLNMHGFIIHTLKQDSS